MMYKKDLVASMKAGGKILREQDSTVFVPFGSEYSLFIKNLRAVKALVKVSIDGEDVLNGRSLIVSPNGVIDLERFLGDNLSQGNRFKFIQKTEKIQDHRGDKIDDGIVRIEFQFEKPEPPKSYAYPAKMMLMNSYQDGDNSIHPSSASIPKGILRGHTSNLSNSGSVGGQSMSGGVDSYAVMDSLFDSSKPSTDEGITVKGSESTQSFTEGTIRELESEKHVITLMLRGATASGAEVRKPILVSTKLECPTCGTSNKSSMKYCGECGTFLQ